MTGPCFVDANVFVYAQDARDPRKHRHVRIGVKNRGQSPNYFRAALKAALARFTRLGCSTPSVGVWP
jgi:predicted nucleic acid-binding protein